MFCLSVLRRVRETSSGGCAGDGVAAVLVTAVVVVVVVMVMVVVVVVVVVTGNDVGRGSGGGVGSDFPSGRHVGYLRNRSARFSV